MYNEPIDEIFLSLKKKKMTPSSWALPININSFFIRVSDVYNSYIIWKQKEEMTRKLYIDRGENQDVEN